MIKKKILPFVLAIIFMLSFPLTASAQEYGNEYPTYVDFSGGAYIEIQSTIGRGTIIVQDTYKIGYIGFYGADADLCNLSNSTITGRLVLTNGTTYNCRFQSFSIPQYYYESGMTREWRNLYSSYIYNTNVEFIDYTSRDRANKIDVFDGDIFKYTVVGLLFVNTVVKSFTIFKVNKYDY